ncbi:hypothetical protein Acr_28g0011670 [Actinidia rufa]|uniref:Uncharacterized protein n=1 Tax=Actinidia rufa TaxID=165716 RepID=A0A7J0HBI7_9ERIC|nr:hypothetical protein Acr_28g0011670 [Actinidia rufa]
MGRLHRSAIIVLFALLSLQLTESADPPHSAPTPAPDSGAGFTPPPESPSPASPSPSPGLRSPPAPPPDNSAPGSSPANKSPSPAPSAPGDAGTVKSHVNDGGEEQNESSGGLGGGQKAGIALGVVAGVCLVALGGILYRKRQQNIQRSQHGYAARRDIL